MKKNLAVCCIVLSLFFLPALSWGGDSATAVAGQGQDQGQNQGQSMGDQSNQQNLGIDFGESTSKRGAHIAPEVQYPGLVSDIAGPSDRFGPNFTRIIDLLKYKSVEIGKPATFTREELAPIAKATERTWGDEPVVKLRIFGGEQLPLSDKISVTFLPLLFGKDGTVAFAGRQDNFQPKGYFHSVATGNEQVTIDVLAVALIMAMDKGINAADVVSEGVVRELYAKGRGLGFNVSGASVNDFKGSAVSGVVGGGTGWSSSESGFNQFPWIQGHLGFRPDMR
ncbi:hypothetical protein KKG48_00280 [Patescibacteria group bacterium]|nr:hypothetical protein [Patescibacteria group bacterium]